METFVTQVVLMLLKGDEPTLEMLRIQLRLSKRYPCEMSGSGFFTHFEVQGEAPRLPGNPSLRFGDVTAEVAGLQYGAGFVLFVENGAIAMLEGYTYDEPWPSAISSYKLSYMGKDERDWDSLHNTPGWPKQTNS